MNRDHKTDSFSWTQTEDSDDLFLAEVREYMSNKQPCRCLLKAELWVDTNLPFPRAATIKVTHCMY